MNKIPTQAENPNGLHQRYIVSKTNGEPIDAGAEYFVLRLDLGGSDPKHVLACRVAVLQYAEAIKDHLPELSKDLMERYGIKVSVEEDAKLPTTKETKNKVACKHGYKSWDEMEGNLLAYRIPFDEIIESHTAAHTAALQERVKELESVAQQFIEAVDREEIIIQENFDNDGWENCGGRLYESFKNALKK